MIIAVCALEWLDPNSAGVLRILVQPFSQTNETLRNLDYRLTFLQALLRVYRMDGAGDLRKTGNLVGV